MYRISIIAIVCVCVAVAAAVGCKNIPKEPAKPAETAEASTAAAAPTPEETQRNDALKAYNEGVDARLRGDHKAARDAFARAVEVRPDYPEAAQALAQEKAALGEAPAPGAGAGLDAQRLQAQLEQVRQDVRALIAQAKAVYQKEQFQEAIDALQEAIDTMNLAAKTYNMDFGAERAEAEELLRNARIQQDVFLKAQEVAQKKAAQEELEAQLRKQAEQRHDKAAQLMKMAREELAKKNFTLASSYARRALFEDPGNSEAMDLSNLIVGQRINFDRERIILRRDIALRKAFLDMQEAAVPRVQSVVLWPVKQEWMEMSKKRLARSEQEQKVFQPTAEQEKIEKILDETKVRILPIPEQSFADAVRTLVKLFAKVVPIVISPEAMTKIGDLKVSVSKTSETSLRTALDELLHKIPKETGEFSYVIKDEAILITIKGAEEGRSLIVYPIQDILRKEVEFQAQSIQPKREDLFKEAASLDTTGGTTTSPTEEYAAEVNNPDTKGPKDFHDVRPEHISEEPPIGLKDLIVNILGGDTFWNYAGGQPGAPATIDFRKGDMYINATGAIHQQVQDILSYLRATNEVLVTLEARFLQVHENLLEEIGVDLTGNPTQAESDRAHAMGLDFTDQFLEGKLTDVSSNGLMVDSHGFPLSGIFLAERHAGVGFLETTTTGAGGGTTGQRIFLPSGVPTGDALGLNGENILDKELASALGGAQQPGLTAGFSLKAGNSQMRFILKAMENSSKSSLLSAPRITTFNLQPAFIASVTERTFIGSVRDVQVDTTAPPSVDPIPSKLPSGIVLRIRPTVTWDRKYVILEVTAFSTQGTLPPNLRRTINLTPPSALAVIGVVVQQPKLEMQFDFPLIVTQNVQTTVIVPDGGTAILGGLAQMQRIQGGASTPLLGDIPLLKFFFSHKGSSNDKDSLVVLIRADITVVPESEKRFIEEN